jgi:hypothetical protein
MKLLSGAELSTVGTARLSKAAVHVRTFAESINAFGPFSTEVSTGEAIIGRVARAVDMHAT